LIFKLDGQKCRAEVLGATTVAERPAPAVSTPARKSPRKKATPEPAGKVVGFSAAA
jgi:hypothetical protein